MNEKRHVASLMPYRIVDGEREFYLQKREADRRVMPGLFTMFGGGIEAGETPEEGCLREIQEELRYVPTQMRYFSRFESADAILHVFFEEVGPDFESRVEVHEGEYGKFIKQSEVRDMKEAALMTRLAAVQIGHYLEGKKY